MTNQVKVVYVMGVFRSGSTIFDMLLGNIEGLVSVGELVNVQQYAWINNDYCSCGSTGDKCAFWSKVKQRWVDENDISIEEFIRIQSNIERFKYWPLVYLKSKLFKKSFASYATGIVSLYKIISDENGGNGVVDSSKNPGRALALSMIPDIDFHVIHLVRDGRGVAWSCLKQFDIDVKKGLQIKIAPVSVWKTSFRWMTINASSTIIASLLKTRAIRIKYEDLMDDFEGELSKLGDFLLVDVAGLNHKVKNNEELSVYHTIAGNRVRMNRTIQIKPDYEWISKITKKQNAIFWIVAGFLAKLYGYKTSLKNKSTT